MNIWIDIMYRIIGVIFPEKIHSDEFNYQPFKLIPINNILLKPPFLSIQMYLPELIRRITSNDDLKPFYYHKIDVWKKQIENPFYTQDIIEKLWNIYCNTQRAYYGFSKLARLFKLKRAKISVTHDLCMNPITLTPGKSISIYHNDSIYYFTLSDLINICKSGLIHSPHFFSDPIYPKNPYINISFTKSIMYYIYYSIRISQYRIPLLLHLFYLSEFNIIKYYLEYEAIIRDEYITDFVKNGSNSDLLDNINDMLYKIPISRHNIYIDTEFPSDTLINIMRPFLKLYLTYILSLSKTEKQFRSYFILKYKLQTFFDFNPQFGRKIFVRDPKRPFAIPPRFVESFNTKHISYNDIHIKNLSVIFHVSEEDMIEYRNHIDTDIEDEDMNNDDDDDDSMS